MSNVRRPSARRTPARLLLAGTGLAALVGATAADADGVSPEIRLSPTNRVPSCAAPERLTAFLRARNDRLDPRYADIARFYREQGDAWRVRWDYAFFQMIVETNALSFRRGNGDPGDVKPRQNNFAGIGTTGGGVPGDSFPDVRTGVAAHIQHLVAYSGERLAEPVAPRTQLKQDDIVEVSRRLKRPVRYADLARRWAVDRRYWQSIEAIASAFRAGYCTTAADLAPLPEAKALSLVAAKPKPAADAAQPTMVREPVMAQRPAARAAGRSAGPVRTVWRAGDAERRSAATPAVDAAPPAAPTPPVVTAQAPAAQPTAAQPTAKPAFAQAAMAQPAAALPVAQPQSPPLAATAAVDAAPPPPSAEAPRKFAFGGGLAMRAGAPLPAAGTAPAPPAATTAATSPVTAGCSITSASYGGSKALLIRSEQDGRVRFTALSVLDGFEASMASNYIRSHAPGGTAVGEFGSSGEALARARELCSGVKLSDAR